MSRNSNWHVGIDIGGTFTDIVATHTASAETRTAKVTTRRKNRIAGLLAALEAVDLHWHDVAELIHGTTLVTNAIVEGELARVALICTAGFSDSLEIGRQNRLHLYRLDLPPKLPPQVPGDRRFEVDERLDYAGHVLRELDAQSIDEAIRQVEASGAEAVAVSLLHAYTNPDHEEVLGRRLAEKFPYVALSNRVNPEAREYERTATTVLSASLMPLTAGYLDQLEAAKPRDSSLHLFHSAGGMAAPLALRDLPLGLALSGPSAGVAAASHMARDLGIKNAISFDMGGTTTDVCLITDGRAQVASDRSLAGRPMRQPMVAVDSIGAGGGSIARLDQGALRVGPESAGADPGPACYGRGGGKPTVSDANLLLGYLDAKRILGDGLQLDVDAARAALMPLAAAMNMTIEQAALGINRVANAAMVRALRRTTVERGIDGRQCTLIAYGGAGPMHAVDVAHAFGIAHIVVPAHSSAFSALGCVSAEISYCQQQSVRMPLAAWNHDKLVAMRTALRRRLTKPLTAAGHNVEEICLEEVASIRYSGQSYAIDIMDPAFDDPPSLGRSFLARHEMLYGFATDEPWELMAIRQRVWVPRSGENITSQIPGRMGEPLIKTTQCVFAAGGAVATPRFDRLALAVGVSIKGPAVIEDAWSTIIVPPDAALTVDAVGNLHLELHLEPHSQQESARERCP